MRERYPEFVSVIIPVYNDPDGISSTLDSLLSQSYEQFEIIPVDNNSDDDTSSTISHIAANHPYKVYPTEETDIQGSYAARNAGIKKAQGDILAFIDSGITVESDWLETIVSVMATRDCDYLGYDVQITTSEHPNIYEKYEHAFSFPMEDYLRNDHFTGAGALVVRSEVLSEVGGFDETLESGGDKEFGVRVYKAGFDQCFTDAVRSYHPARKSLDELTQKAKRVGRGQLQLRETQTNANIHHPLHPFRFLPPSPLRLRRQLSTDEYPFKILVIFYFIEFYLKFVQSTYVLRRYIESHPMWSGERQN